MRIRTAEPKAINVLFTSVGRRVELVRAFRDAYRTLGIGGRIVATDHDALAAGLQEVDRFHLVPRIDDATYLPVLERICRAEAIDLVFPLLDPDIPALARGRELLERAGARVVVVNEAAAELVTDKWRTLDLFRRLSVPVPLSWLPHEVDPATAEYPLFVKPRRGSASKNAFVVRNARELEFFLEYVPEAMIQELLPGPEITVDVVSNLDGEFLGAAARRRIEVRWGEVAKGVTVDAPEAVDHSRRIASELKAAGPITIQCILKEGRPHFTEINARYGGGAPLGIAAGLRSPEWLLAEAAGVELVNPPGAVRSGLHLTRYDCAHILTQEKLAETEQHRI